MKKILFISISILLIVSFAHSANEDFSFRLEADQKIIEFVDAGDVLSLEAFAHLSLLASGSTQETIRTLTDRLFELEAELHLSIPVGISKAEKAEFALTFLYDKVLRRYSEFQTRVDVALQNGSYNCVSSAVLYHFFAKSLGLEVIGVQTPDHAFCMVKIDGSFIDVETTNPYGYDPGKKKPLESLASERERYVVLPQTIYRNRSAVSERSLISLIYHNRITSLGKNGHYDAALSLAIDAWTLIGKPIKDPVLFSHLRNYAVFLMGKKAYNQTLSYLDTVRNTVEGDTEFSDIRYAAIAKIVNGYLDDSNFEAAFVLLNERESDINATDFSKMFAMVLFNSLYVQVQKASFPDSLSLISEYRSRLLSGDWERLVTHVYSKEADRIAKTNEWMQAVILLDEALLLLPKRAELVKQRSVYRQNRASDIHNSAASAWNKGDTQKAREIIESGLREIPESTLLKNDLRLFSR